MCTFVHVYVAHVSICGQAVRRDTFLCEMHIDSVGRLVSCTAFSLVVEQCRGLVPHKQ